MSDSEIKVGQTIECGSRTVSEAEILAFAQRYDPQPMHIDREVAVASPWGGLIASGWMTCAIAMELVTRRVLLGSQSIGSPGVENIRWEKPVRAGDQVAVKVHVLDSRISSNKKYRVVRWRWEMDNQRGDRVLQLICTSLFLRETAHGEHGEGVPR